MSTRVSDTRGWGPCQERSTRDTSYLYSSAKLTNIVDANPFTDTQFEQFFPQLGAYQVLRNAIGGGVCPISQKKQLQRCTVQRYKHYEELGGCQIKNVT